MRTGTDTHMSVSTGTTMVERDLAPKGALAVPALLKLMTFLSPAFPVGAFSYSHGLEFLIDRRDIRHAGTLAAWLANLLESGSLWNDAVLFAEAYRAARLAAAELLAVAELAEALAPSSERHLEAMAQGRAFIDAVAAAWPSPKLAPLSERGGAPYSVAVGATAAAHGISLEAALPAYLAACVANLVSVGVRLVPLGQSAGLQILAKLHPLIATTARHAEESSLDDLGSATVLADIASMLHETQYSRVFRT